jgi:hypothetical protein
MKTGDIVRVYPSGQQKRSAHARISILSGNQRSIAVCFEDKPPFQIGNPMAIHPEHGIMFFGYREQASGPWTELFEGVRTFEIEELPQ